MRPLRLLLSVCFVVLTILLTFYTLLRSHSQNGATQSSQAQRSGLRTPFSFHVPSTLFPPSAIISLYDDNSTFFLSRPADFGPPLAADGQSGQLWIGSGFRDDSIAKGGIAAQAEGELGCSDIPGWLDGQKELPGEIETPTEDSKSNISDDDRGDSNKEARSENSLQEAKRKQKGFNAEDGTDDHLHYPLRGVPLLKGHRSGRRQQASKGDDMLEHADIQALQESAEITGKVVLLSRGGCGFLEKTKWVQRRGGVALIVGDNSRGGPLITMYAHGDISNITIPSLFTSRTSAHLLSSLIPAGKGQLAVGKNPTKTVNGKEGSKVQENGQGRTTFTPKAEALKTLKSSSTNKKPETRKSKTGKSSWFHSMIATFGLGGKGSGMNSDHRPPSSGRVNWVQAEDWDDQLSEKLPKDGTDATAKSEALLDTSLASVQTDQKRPDGFVIGVQDWRDPDMLGPAKSDGPDADGAKFKSTSTSTATSNRQQKDLPQSTNKALSGGSITPGSGVYHDLEGKADSHNQQLPDLEEPVENDEMKRGWLSSLFGSEDTANDDLEAEKAARMYKQKVASHFVQQVNSDDSPDDGEDREGLWVTMSPASISASPFFDTLLVLVVSPLVTLTVVYALLLLRSRIRRRRWRAPKSVVEQLPVRTYHTLSCSSSSTSSQTSSPNNSSPTSPLLRSGSRPNPTRPRPRSRTTSTLSDAASATFDDNTDLAVFPKRERVRSPRRYKGKQIECVVCLEEYVDGQSQVMSLPCGHEFHAECITPWLTTRRRTCPICKGDVVRSLTTDSRTSSSTSRQARHLDTPHSSHDLPTETSSTRNESPSAAIPIPVNEDLERGEGDDMAATLVDDRPTAYTPRGGWRALAARSLTAIAGSGERSWRQAGEDRDR